MRRTNLWRGRFQNLWSIEIIQTHHLNQIIAFGRWNSVEMRIKENLPLLPANWRGSPIHECLLWLVRFPQYWNRPIARLSIVHSFWPIRIKILISLWLGNSWFMGKLMFMVRINEMNSINLFIDLWTLLWIGSCEKNGLNIRRQARQTNDKLLIVKVIVIKVHYWKLRLPWKRSESIACCRSWNLWGRYPRRW